MTFDLIIWFWLAAGLLMIVAEVVLPGAIAVFLGLAALIVGAGLHFGMIHGWIEAFTLWFIFSLVLILVLRSLLQRWMQGDVEKQNTDEDLDAFGAIAEVVETIDPAKDGRIRFRGTTWTAKCFDQNLLPGSKARIVAREEMSWIVEPMDLIDE